MNLFDSPQVAIAFVDQQREVKYFADKVLHIAELPIGTNLRDADYKRIELTRKKAETDLAKINELLRSTILEVPFKLKDGKNEILLTTKEQLESMSNILRYFLERNITKNL